MSRRGKIIEGEARDVHLTLTGLMKKEWKIYRSSLILSRNAAEDKNLVETASWIIANALPKMPAFSLSLTRCPAIQLSELSPPALLVELFIEGALQFLGYFINWSLWSTDVEEGYRLPIYLFRGKVDIARAVNAALVKTFDCVMTPMELNASQLIKLLTLFVRFADEKEEKCAVLKYSIPGMAQGNISVTNDLRSLLTILKFLVEAAQEDENVSLTFYEKLMNHYSNAYQLNLSHAVLRNVSLPHAMASDTGLIRLDNENVLSASLALLDSFFPVPQPTSAISVPSIGSSCP